MRQQLEVMQAELIYARGGGPSTTDVQVLTYLQLPHIVTTKMSYMSVGVLLSFHVPQKFYLFSET